MSDSKREDAKFAGSRLAEWRGKELSKDFASTLDNIEKYGCEVFQITADLVSPRFSYTVGVFDTSGRPELITVGLTEEMAHSALNEAAESLRGGVDLTRGRFREIGEVEVEFRSVDPKWLHHVMLRTNWYYEGDNVPVLQLIYPDLENRFQWEEGFTEYFRQPLLQSGVEQGQPEEDFWAAYDETSSLSGWKFPDPPHTKAYLSETVHKKEEIVTYVSHDADDGAWQFLGDRMDEGGGPVLACLHHPIDEDRTLEELADLPLGWYAVRETPNDPWQRFEKEPDEDESEAVGEDNP